VPVLAIKERQLLASATARLSLAETLLALRIDELGKGIGSPWAKDQKNAAMIAWLALR
jgi:hypothetical protein